MKLSMIVTCPNCKMQVLPKADGTCPSCQSMILQKETGSHSKSIEPIKNSAAGKPIIQSPSSISHVETKTKVVRKRSVIPGSAPTRLKTETKKSSDSLLVRVVIWLIGLFNAMALFIALIGGLIYHEFPEDFIGLLEVVVISGILLLIVLIRMPKYLASAKNGVTIVRNILRGGAFLVVVGLVFIITQVEPLWIILICLSNIIFLLYLITFPKAYYRPPGAAQESVLERMIGLKCPDCRRPISENDINCPHCGVNLEDPSAEDVETGLENKTISTRSTRVAHRKHTGGLTAFLILLLVVPPLLILYYSFAGSSVSQSIPVMPEWVIHGLEFLSIANFVFAVAIWQWKKWGVYGFYISLGVISVITGFGSSGLISNLGGLWGIVGILFLGYLLRPGWSQME